MLIGASLAIRCCVRIWGPAHLQSRWRVAIGAFRHSPEYFGSLKGASLIDALDTLILMNMTDEVAHARGWIEQHLDFNVGGTKVSTFETTIRFLGGLL